MTTASINEHVLSLLRETRVTALWAQRCKSFTSRKNSLIFKMEFIGFSVGCNCQNNSQEHKKDKQNIGGFWHKSTSASSWLSPKSSRSHLHVRGYCYKNSLFYVVRTFIHTDFYVTENWAFGKLVCLCDFISLATPDKWQTYISPRFILCSWTFYMYLDKCVSNYPTTLRTKRCMYMDFFNRSLKKCFFLK